MSPSTIAFFLASHVLALAAGFILGFYWLKSQLESKMAGIMDFSSDGGLEADSLFDEGDFDE